MNDTIYRAMDLLNLTGAHKFHSEVRLFIGFSLDGLSAQFLIFREIMSKSCEANVYSRHQTINITPNAQ